MRKRKHQKIKKTKKIKKPKPVKTKEDRIKETDLIKEKIFSLGLSEEHEGVSELFRELDIFMNNGYSCSGKIKLVGNKRVIHFNLVRLKQIKSTICLKYNPEV